MSYPVRLKTMHIDILLFNSFNQKEILADLMGWARKKTLSIFIILLVFLFLKQGFISRLTNKVLKLLLPPATACPLNVMQVRS